jgi:hypothetical protein
MRPCPPVVGGGGDLNKHVKKPTCCVIAVLLGMWSVLAQNQSFTPGQLAVLRAGDGAINLRLKQAPIFVDQFDPMRFNEAASLTVAIPTNGPNALFFNGHAATEGNLTRSADRRLLVLAGYAGVDLLQHKGVPSQLSIPRGVGTLGAAAGSFKLVFQSTNWYQASNPRGVATDGAGNFWGCGSTYGTLFYNAQTTPQPLEFRTLLNTRAIKIINQVLYATLNSADGLDTDDSAGIYNYLIGPSPAGLPTQADATMHLVVPTAAGYNKTCGFDVNPAGTIAYMADTQAGIQKYIKGDGGWKFAHNFAIPQVIPDSVNNGKGCFGLTVDFSGAAPIIYATTTEGWETMNSNRVVRIVDTNANAVVTTVAQAANTNIVYRGVEFTPESGSPPSASR